MEKVKLTRSSGNVFRDLGFSGHEAEYLKVRAELMVSSDWGIVSPADSHLTSRLFGQIVGRSERLAWRPACVEDGTHGNPG